MVEEPNTDDDGEQFSIAQTGPVHYTVKSVRNDDVTAHRVNIQDLQCSCEDMTFNKDNSGVTPDSSEGRIICDHLAAVLDEHPQLNTTEQALYKAMGVMENAASLNAEISAQRDRLEKAIVQLRDAQAGLEAQNNAASNDSSGSASSTDKITAKEASDNLQEALDEAAEGLETQAHNGYVWVNKTPDAPDWTFDAFLSHPGLMEYDPDNGPGDYWKNRIDPEDVDEYITEVLE